MHALRDCQVIKAIWFQLGRDRLDDKFFVSDSEDWLADNGMFNYPYSPNQPPWKSVFLFAIWSIWLKRNLLVFHNKSAHHSLIPEILSKSSEFFHCTMSPRNAPRMTTKLIKWEKPASEWVKLNTVGSSLGNPGIAGCGGLVRDEDGKWVIGFARKIWKSSSFIAEIWALRDGLNVCLRKNLLLVEVELDAKAVVDILARPNNSSEANSPLVDDCRHLIAQFHQIRINHCYREANRCADTLARMGTNQSQEFVLFHSPPMDLEFALLSDFNGLYYPRLCPEFSVSV